MSTFRNIICPVGSVVRVLRNTLPSGKPPPPFYAVVVHAGRYGMFRVRTPHYAKGEADFGPLMPKEFEVVEEYWSTRPFSIEQRLEKWLREP